MPMPFIVLAYLTLVILAVPWYWPADDRTVWLGLPAWVVVAIAVSFAVSVLTAAILSRPWAHEEKRDHE